MGTRFHTPSSLPPLHFCKIERPKRSISLLFELPAKVFTEKMLENTERRSVEDTLGPCRKRLRARFSWLHPNYEEGATLPM